MRPPKSARFGTTNPHLCCGKTCDQARNSRIAVPKNAEGGVSRQLPSHSNELVRRTSQFVKPPISLRNRAGRPALISRDFRSAATELIVVFQFFRIPRTWPSRPIHATLSRKVSALSLRLSAPNIYYRKGVMTYCHNVAFRHALYSTQSLHAV